MCVSARTCMCRFWLRSVQFSVGADLCCFPMWENGLELATAARERAEVYLHIPFFKYHPNVLTTHKEGEKDGEREKDRERGRERGKDRQRGREREKDREKEGERPREKGRERGKDREKDAEGGLPQNPVKSGTLWASDAAVFLMCRGCIQSSDSD